MVLDGIARLGLDTSRGVSFPLEAAEFGLALSLAVPFGWIFSL